MSWRDLQRLAASRWACAWAFVLQAGPTVVCTFALQASSALCLTDLRKDPYAAKLNRKHHRGTVQTILPKSRVRARAGAHARARARAHARGTTRGVDRRTDRGGVPAPPPNRPHSGYELRRSARARAARARARRVWHVAARAVSRRNTCTCTRTRALTRAHTCLHMHLYMHLHTLTHARTCCHAAAARTCSSRAECR